MDEATESLKVLDALMQASIARAGAYLRESFQLPEHSLDSAELRALFARARAVAFATVTSRGEPRVAPVDAFLAGATFWIPTVEGAARRRHVSRNPATSLSCFDKDWAVIAHGTSSVVRPSEDEFGLAEELALEAGLSSVLEWGEGVYIRFEPSTLLTWRRNPPRQAN
jgi:Pyridoxamine 5'-phosphate oxidase